MAKRTPAKKAASPKGETDQPKKRVHRKKSEKLVKKANFKKNKVKFKIMRRGLRAIKQDKDELRKLGIINKEFAMKVPCD